MFLKRQRQIQELSDSIFEGLEKAKLKREDKLLKKLRKTIDKQLQDHCSKVGTELMQKYITKIDELSPSEIKELVEQEIAS